MAHCCVRSKSKHYFSVDYTHQTIFHARVIIIFILLFTIDTTLHQTLSSIFTSIFCQNVKLK